MKAKFLSVPLFVLALLASCAKEDDGLPELNGSNEEVVSITASNFNSNINENIESNTSIGFIEASINSDESLSYTLTSQTPLNGLAIDSVTGEIIVNDATIFDYEANTEITAEITISSSELNEVVNINIDINNLVEALIVASESSNEWLVDVQTLIKSVGDFQTVDIHNSYSSTDNAITVDELNKYDAVVVWTDSYPAFASELGDNLATYIDNGGGVVEAVFGGNIKIDGNYDAYKAYDTTASIGQRSGSELTLGTLTVSDHEILDGVTTLNGGTASFHNTNISPVVGAIEVAQWSNGEPLVLVRENVGDKSSSVVFLNFFPPSINQRADFWNVETDGAILISNALKFVAK